MNVIFDKKEVASHGNPEDPNNTPEKLVERCKEKLTKLGEFIGADIVEFKSPRKKEFFIITKGKKTITLTANGDGYDGGWLTVS